MAITISVSRLAQIVIAGEAATGRSSKPIVKAIIASWNGDGTDQQVEDEIKEFLNAGVDYLWDHPYMAAAKTGIAIAVTELLRDALKKALKGKKTSVSVFGLFNVGV